MNCTPNIQKSAQTFVNVLQKAKDWYCFDVALSLTIYFYEVVKDMPPFHLPLHDAGTQDDEAISKPKQNIDGSGQ